MGLAEQLQSLGADVHPALERIPVPVFLSDRHGILRWGNAAAIAAFGDVRGSSFQTVVEPDSLRAAQESFARKIVGTEEISEVELTLRLADGSRARAEVSTVSLAGDGHVVGVFGVVDIEGSGSAPPPEHVPQLTPRQHEVLTLLARGATTGQVAAELGISVETVRNHVRDLLHRLGVHTRLEAVVHAHELGLV